MPPIAANSFKNASEDSGLTKAKYYDEVELDAAQLAATSEDPKVITHQPTELTVAPVNPDTCKDYMKQAAGCCLGISCIVIWIGAEILGNIPLNLLC
ncbi:unnamed protein product [Auanema sp. JU1783]|nr:unnamed protein product [Auanema sp. JU1783]